MIKAIIFDNNGVLTLSDRENTVSNFARYFGIDEKELHKVFDEFAEDLDDGSETTLQFYQKIADYFDKNFEEKELREVHIQSYQPKAGMHELVLELKKKFTVALLTNFGDAFDEANGRVWHHNEVFDEENMFVSCKLGMRKPDLAIYKYALSRLGFIPNECVFIDDRESNLLPARKLGMHTILFKSPEQCKNELKLLLEESNVKK